ncbi:transposase [Bacteroides sp. AN502(2024)]|uniref:transposase n=1 Tax=Bacteroides sp. AN502(2024) TaxID=3160599 RepID=UPI0035182010
MQVLNQFLWGKGKFLCLGTKCFKQLKHLETKSHEILNLYNNRSSNALAESFDAKIKLFRANLRGVADKKFFLFRIANLYAYPH